MSLVDIERTIYKQDSKGKLRFLTVSTFNGELIQTSGLVGGQEVEHRKMCKAKNVGRANETTPEEQAVSEAESLITKKLREGYFSTKEEAENSKIILPMLAKSFKDEKHKVNYPCFLQPKFDGMRCLAICKIGTYDVDIKLISRKNVEIDTMKHVQLSLSLMFGVRDFEGEIIFDGELYAHGMTFQENMKLIKKYRPGETEKIRYHIYDIVDENKSFRERKQVIDEFLGHKNEFPILSKVQTYIVYNEESVNDYHTKLIGDGYEGSIIRHGDAGYHIKKRSSNLLKHKDFIDEAFLVIDVIPSDANPDQGVVMCKHGGHTFNCGMKFSHEEREEILTNKQNYIGKVAEVRFFEYTDDGLPRFPVCVGFRLDK